MKTFLLIVLVVIMLFCCAVGDAEDGCCGIPGPGGVPKKLLTTARILLPIAVVGFVIIYKYL